MQCHRAELGKRYASRFCTHQNFRPLTPAKMALCMHTCVRVNTTKLRVDVKEWHRAGEEAQARRRTTITVPPPPISHAICMHGWGCTPSKAKRVHTWIRVDTIKI